MLPKKVGLIMPTCGLTHIHRTIDRLIANTTDQFDIDLVFSINPIHEGTGKGIERDIQGMFLSPNLQRQHPFNLIFVHNSAPVGFAKA